MNAIEIKNLTKTYTGFCLQNLNLTLPSGCIMGIVGENGAGKSTTIRLIMDMIERDEGTITIMGMDNRENIRLLKEETGVVLDEVGFPECMDAKQVNKMMKGTYKNWDEHLFEDYLKKLSVPDNKSFRAFSKGMKMKLGIAVALSHSPKLLILDEATGGLDPVVRDEVLEIFEEFTRDESHSVLISSHIVSDLEKICDYIAFLHKGKLLLCEEKDRLKEEYGLLHCTSDFLSELSEKAVFGKRESAYGVEALVRRDAVPETVELCSVGIEDIFLFMVKGDR